MMQFQLWVQVGATWVMLGFFDVEYEARDKLDKTKGVEDYRIVKVETLEA